jgi:hypothetical protein
MLPGEILKSVEEYIYFVGLLPCDVMTMTLLEIGKVYDNRMKKINLDNKADDMRTARICCILANINRDTKKKRKPFTEDDFMPQEKAKNKPQTPEQMANILKLFTIANGGKVPKR